MSPVLTPDPVLSKYKKSGRKLSEKAALLEEAKWITEINWEQIQTLANFFELYDIPQGVQLFQEGSKTEYLGVIIQGEVEIYKEDSKSRKKTVTKLKRGNMFGEMSLLDNSPRSASAATTEPVLLCVLSREQFELLLQAKPKLGIIVVVKLAKQMSLKLRQTSAKLVEFLNS